MKRKFAIRVTITPADIDAADGDLSDAVERAVETHPRAARLGPLITLSRPLRRAIRVNERGGGAQAGTYTIYRSATP